MEIGASVHPLRRIFRGGKIERMKSHSPWWVVIFVIVAVTWLIAAGEFSHVIAGSGETALAAMRGQIGWDQYALGFLLPALVGNSIGGVVFVALLNHAQVKEEI